MEETVMVSCSVYKLLKEGSRYVKSGKKLDRTDIILPRGYVEEKNYSWETNGLWHEKDEEKTNAFYKAQELKYKAKQDAQKKKGQLTEVMSEILENANKSNKPTKSATKKEETVDSAEELDVLKAEYQEKFGKKAHHLWGIDKLKEKLQ